MTEAEWLACDQPERMMKRFYPRPSARKYRLFSCVCCRHAWEVSREVPSPLAVRAIEVAERYAEGLATKADLEDCRTRLFDVIRGRRSADHDSAAYCVTGQRNVMDAKEASRLSRRASCSPDEASIQVGFNKDIFGNPFRPAVFSPSWRTDTAISLARTMYDSREFSAMPILADALQDAGCDSDDVLTHCRDANATHVRGCWVCDLVLGKE
jgi:hypothetical protein